MPETLVSARRDTLPRVILAAGDGSFRLALLGRVRNGSPTIEIEVHTSRGDWTSVDPGLERGDVRSLIRWLKKIARGKTPKELGFMEPNLRFECLSNTNEARIRVWFEGEARPAWAPFADWGMEDLWLDLGVQRDQVARAAEVLATELDAIEA